jgi:tetratricopeptide (TPR) repeat protein
MHAPDALPLLQYTLQTLYLKREPGGELTWAAYAELGGLEGAIGSRAEAILATLPVSQQAALPRLLPRLVSLAAEDAVPTSRTVPSASLIDPDEAALVQALVEEHLLVADRIGGVTGFRVAHEALLRQWLRVTAWVSQHRATLAARDELMPWVQRWLDGARAAALLLPRGSLLWQSSGAIASVPHLFGPDEREFLARSQAKLKWQARRRWAAAAGAVALALVAVIAAVRNAQLARTASARELESRRLATFMLGDLADQLRPIGKLDMLNSVGEQGLSVLSAMDARDELPPDTLQRAKALVVIAEVNSSRGRNHLAVARAALARATDLLTALGHPATRDAAEYYKTLGASAFWLGQIAFDAGNFDEASRQMARYRQSCDQWLAAAPKDPQARVELGYALSSLSSIAMKRGAWDEAWQGFQASLALKQAVLAKQPAAVEVLDAIASTRTWLGQVAHIQGKPEQALALYDAARATQLQLLKQRPHEAVRLRDLGVLDVLRAETLRALGRRDAAVAARLTSLSWLDQALVNGASNVFWQAERLHAESGLLLAEVDTGRAADRRLVSLRQRLSRQDGLWPASQPLRHQTLAQVALAEAELATRAGAWADAREHARRAAQELRTLMSEHPHQWQGRELRARAGLLVLRLDAATTAGRPSRSSCAALRAGLQPAVDSGQAGFALEAWLIARECADGGGPTATELQTLRAGGYQPRALDFFDTRKLGTAQ